MKVKNKELFIEVFSALAETHAKLNDLIHENELIRFDRIIDSNAGYVTVIMELASPLFGISRDWLDWFIYENEFGDKQHSCYMGEKEFKIDSAQAFVEFLELLKE